MEKQSKYQRFCDGFGVATLRLGEYIREFGLKGIWLSLSHNLKYKLRERTEPIVSVIPGFGEIYLRPRSSDLATFREIVINKDYGLEKHGVASYIELRKEEIIADGRVPLVLDIGANIGLASRHFALHLPDTDIIAIEPGAENLSVAERNVREFPQVTLRRTAVWSEVADLVLSDSRDQSSRSLVHDKLDNLEHVTTTTMGALTEGREDDLLLVKIDIEGAEKFIFRLDDVCSGWLRSFPIVFIEGHDGSHNQSGSLAGILQHTPYREGRITLSGPAMICVPTPHLGQL